MGSQSEDESGPNYDPISRSSEPLRRETLGAFLLARHELTQAQWLRLAGGENPCFYKAGMIPEGVQTITPWAK